MEDCLPHGRNLLKQFDLEGLGPCTLSCTEPTKEVVVDDGGSEASIEDHLHRLPHHLNKIYATVVTYPFWDQDHRLPGLLLL